ncbi:MAG: hypothetical protein SWX82_10125 [Cyanobacteriota bacterium]|nr:hypothetical protein [Cyanobacteriota bacterium]
MVRVGSVGRRGGGEIEGEKVWIELSTYIYIRYNRIPYNPDRGGEVRKTESG